MGKTGKITFILNGKKTTVDFAKEGLSPSTTVLHYLRGKGVRSVKSVCEEGDCGACSIVVGKPDGSAGMTYSTYNSCILFLPWLDGKEVITAEHLAEGENLHPVQQAMVSNHAIQCGYCTPGFTMSLFSLFHSGENIDRKALELTLAGNLCRCTGYHSIYKAGMSLNDINREDKFSRREKSTASELQNIAKETVFIQTDDREYFRPLTLTQALEYRRDNPDAVIIAGATDVALLQNKKNVILTKIMDLSAVEELNFFRRQDNTYEWGATLSIEKVKNHLPLPPWQHLFERYASKQIRNIASFGGNIANASPVGDTLPLLIAYKAAVKLTSLTGERRVPVEDFITGYRKTQLKQDELITSIVLPVPEENTYIRSYKISKRKHVDISTLSAAFRLTVKDGICTEAVFAYGGMAETVKRAKEAENFLTGKPLTKENIHLAAAKVKQAFTPISDVRAPSEYRSAVAENLLRIFADEILMEEI